MSDYFKRDKQIIRDGFKVYSSKNFNERACCYSEIGAALERMHANMLLKYCKVRGYNRKETKKFFKERHKRMLSLLDDGMDMHDFPKDIYE